MEESDRSICLMHLPSHFCTFSISVERANVPCVLLPCPSPSCLNMKVSNLPYIHTHTPATSSEQRVWLTETPGNLWSINNDKSPGGTQGFPFLLQFHTHATQVHSWKAPRRGQRSNVGLMSRLWGSSRKGGRGQKRMQFILLSSWFRMKEANTERGSGVQPVQRHWDSSKCELETEPERKRGKERMKREMQAESKDFFNVYI